MMHFNAREYGDVINAVCCILSIASNKCNSAYGGYTNECHEQITKLRTGEIDFDKIVSLLVPYARYEMEFGFRDYAEQILHLICILQFHQDSPMLQDMGVSYRLSK